MKLAEWEILCNNNIIIIEYLICAYVYVYIYIYIYIYLFFFNFFLLDMTTAKKKNMPRGQSKVKEKITEQKTDCYENLGLQLS